MAGSMTLQSVTQMIICHFGTDPKSLAKARAEFDALVAEALKETGDEKPKSKQELLSKFVTYDNMQKLDYIQQVINECLRFRPPA